MTGENEALTGAQPAPAETPFGDLGRTSQEARSWEDTQPAPAAQPAASGVEWLAEAMEKAHAMQRKYHNAINWSADTDDDDIAQTPATRAAWADYHAARDSLRTHLSTALTGAAKD